MGYKILSKKELCPNQYEIKVDAPYVVRNAKAGQFIIFRANADSERVPLTIADVNKDKGELAVNTYELIKHLVENEEREKFFLVFLSLVCAVAYPGINKDRQALEEVVSDKSTLLAGILDGELSSDFLYKAYGVTE